MSIFSISEFSKIGKVTARALRLYEKKGLISPSYRGANGYRFYHPDLLERLKQIQKLQFFGFSLDEIKKVVSLDHDRFQEDLRSKLAIVRSDISKLREKEDEIEELLSVSVKIKTGKTVNQSERKLYMDAIKSEVIQSLGKKAGAVTEAHLDFLDRDESFYNSEEKKEFLQAIRSCLQFAKEKNLLLGPGRGSSGQ